MKYELGVALPYKDRCFGFAMVVVLRRRLWRNRRLGHPDLLRPDRGTADRRESLHALRLGRIGADF